MSIGIIPPPWSVAERYLRLSWNFSIILSLFCHYCVNQKFFLSYHRSRVMSMSRYWVFLCRTSHALGRDMLKFNFFIIFLMQSCCIYFVLIVSTKISQKFSNLDPQHEFEVSLYTRQDHPYSHNFWYRPSFDLKFSTIILW